MKMYEMAKPAIQTQSNVTCPECGFVESVDIPQNY